jgi:hypothetical protein
VEEKLEQGNTKVTMGVGRKTSALISNRLIMGRVGLRNPGLKVGMADGWIGHSSLMDTGVALSFERETDQTTFWWQKGFCS